MLKNLSIYHSHSNNVLNLDCPICNVTLVLLLNNYRSFTYKIFIDKNFLPLNFYIKKHFNIYKCQKCIFPYGYAIKKNSLATQYSSLVLSWVSTEYMGCGRLCL